jgi:hypothetical protein
MDSCERRTQILDRGGGSVSKIILPSIAITAVALYLITRNRKVELEFEMEPKRQYKPDAGSMGLADTEVLNE